MDLKIFFATFGAVFLAELADKTQMVSIGMSAKSGKPFTVWLGSVAAYIMITAVSVVVGSWLGNLIKPEIMRTVSGGLFMIIGLLIFAGRI
ncbi:MAG: TMEM165/GDT1 family protein [Candidatus Omnitrophota bacterium]